MFQFNPVIYPVSYAITRILPLILMGVLIFNVSQRFIKNEWGKKRFAVLYVSITLIVLYSGAALIMRFGLSDLMLVPLCLGIIVFVVWKRKAYFPFALRCVRCKAPLTIKAIISEDSNLCKTCLDQAEKRDS
jgi:hypothetical protein